MDVTRVELTGAALLDCTAPQYEWDLGDGEHATGSTVSHVYHRVGSYQIELLVEGCGASLSKTISYSVGSLSGSWGRTYTSGPFTPPGVPVTSPLRVTQLADRIEGDVPSLAFCPLDRDPATGGLRFAVVTGELRHPRLVTFRWACGTFDGSANETLDRLTSNDGRLIYVR